MTVAHWIMWLIWLVPTGYVTVVALGALLFAANKCFVGWSESAFVCAIAGVMLAVAYFGAPFSVSFSAH